MSDIAISFAQGLVFGSVEGAAEGMLGAHFHVPKKKQQTTKSKPTKSKSTRSQERFDYFKTKKRKAGLRPGDKPRTEQDLVHLFYSIPSKTRKNSNDDVFHSFLKNREFGHQKAYSNNGDNSVNNFMWQDALSNRKLNSKNMDPKLKSLLKQQNSYFGKNGKDSTLIKQKIADHQLKQSGKKKSKKKTNKKVNRKQTSKTLSTGSEFKGKVVKKGLNAAASAGGNVVGKTLGRTGGKAIVKVVGKKLAKKVGGKVLKVIPVVGTIVAVGGAAATIYSNPWNVFSYVSAISDVGTSFLGPLGVVADVVIQSGCEVLQ